MIIASPRSQTQRLIFKSLFCPDDLGKRANHSLKFSALDLVELFIDIGGREIAGVDLKNGDL
jgi:hypothetical protein